MEGASGVARVLPTGLVQKGVRVLLFILLVQETWEFLLFSPMVGVSFLFLFTTLSCKKV